MNGGYDDGYSKCPCFWGATPSSMMKLYAETVRDLKGLRILDIGCGEAKDAIFAANAGAIVLGFDISSLAIANARKNAGTLNIDLRVDDIRSAEIGSGFDAVIAYGVVHCLKSTDEVLVASRKIQNATTVGGYNIFCAFNSRRQDIEQAHPGFHPILLEHKVYADHYKDWDVLHLSDTDLEETHPHNQIPHCHSLTRILARKRSI